MSDFEEIECFRQWTEEMTEQNRLPPRIGHISLQLVLHGNKGHLPEAFYGEAFHDIDNLLQATIEACAAKWKEHFPQLETVKIGGVSGS